MAKSPDTTDEVSINVVPVGTIRAEVLPTLDAAFMLLCEAMLPLLDEDLPSQLHVQDIMGWYQNGPSNHAIAWQHAVLLLEQVLNVPLRGQT